MSSVNHISVKDCVDSLLLREGDTSGLKRAQYNMIAKDLYQELQLKGIKDTRRYLMQVDKSFNGIVLPEDYSIFSTIYVISEEGRPIPLIRNSDLSEDIIDLSTNKSCSCHCECGGDLCSQLNNYELILTQIDAAMPDGSTQAFTMTEKKKVNKDGSFVQVVTRPVAVYEGGIHVRTELQTVENYLCKLDVKDCGCVKETPDNCSRIDEHCIFTNCKHECGSPCEEFELEFGKLEYNISDDGSRIIFPSTFTADYVVVRYYANKNTKDIEVPILAKKVFMIMMQKEIVDFDVKAPSYLKRDLDSKLDKELGAMLSNMSRMTLSEQYNMIHPFKRMV